MANTRDTWWFWNLRRYHFYFICKKRTRFGSCMESSLVRDVASQAFRPRSLMRLCWARIESTDALARAVESSVAVDALDMGMIVKTKWKGRLYLISKITRAELSSQYMKVRKPLMDKRSRFIFTVHDFNLLRYVRYSNICSAYPHPKKKKRTHCRPPPPIFIIIILKFLILCRC